MLGIEALPHIKKGILLFLFTFLSFILPLFSQEVNNTFIQYTHYGTEDGMSGQVVNCSLQDSKGFVWLVTNYGLSRFDGESIVNYSSEDLGVTLGTVTDIIEDKDGNLWLSEISLSGFFYSKRIFIFNPIEERIELYSKSEKDVYHSVSCDIDNSILLGNSKGDLLTYDGLKEKLIYTLKDGVPISQIVATKQYYWLNSQSKITLIDRNGQFIADWNTEGEFFFGGVKEESIYVRELYETNSVLQNRILFLNATDESLTIAPVNKSNDDLKVDEKWKYLTEQKKFCRYFQMNGLSIYNENGELYFNIESLMKDAPYLNVNNIYYDREDCLWISTTTGIYHVQITPSNFTSYLHTETSSNYSMRSMIAIGDSLYCNTYSGNIIFDLKKEEIVKKLPESDINYGLSSVKTKDNCIYFAGTGHVVQRICKDIEQNNIFRYDAKSIGNDGKKTSGHWAIIEDKNGNIWLGTNRGLSFLNLEKGILEKFTKYNQFSQLSETIVFDILETKSGFWIAAQNGLYKMEQNTGITAWFHSGAPTPDSNYLPADIIFSIYEDADGFLWLTTQGSGLIRLVPKTLKYKQITVKEGLSHNVTNDILEDDFNNLWISTNRGITRFNRKNGAIMQFDKSDGLHLEEFNKRSSTKLEDGRMVFGGVNGIVVFHPNDFLEVSEKEENGKPLYITQLIINDTIKNSIDLGEKIKLDKTKTNLTFNLRILDFAQAKPASYEWKWKDTDMEFKKLPSSQLHLSEVPYGENTLIFRATSAEGILALNELEVSISTPTLFSVTQIVIGLGLLLGLYYLLFWRNKKKEVKVQTSSEIIIIEDKVKTEENVEKGTIPKQIVPIVLSSTDKKWLNDLTKKIHETDNIGKFSVEAMAKEANLSSRQLNRKIKQLTGITPNQYLRDIKLERAKTLLESGTISTVAEASFAVGFEKPDYFSRLYKEKYGVRPISYFDKKKK